MFCYKKKHDDPLLSGGLSHLVLSFPIVGGPDGDNRCKSSEGVGVVTHRGR